MFVFVLDIVICVYICIWYCNLCLYCVCRGVEELNWQDEAAMYYLKVTHGCGCPPSSHVEQPDKSKQIFIGTLQNKTLPKALRTQALTTLTSCFGLVLWVQFSRFGFVGLVW